MTIHYKPSTFYKHYMICEYDCYYVYRPDPNAVSFPLCKASTIDEAKQKIDDEIKRIAV